MTTKEQERKALERIRKIVESLGEQSYIGTAFEGCFEKAEENIEYDAAFSWKGEAECERKKAQAVEQNYRELQLAMTKQTSYIIELKGRISDLEKAAVKDISDDDLFDCIQLADKTAAEAEEAAVEAAKTIVEYAENPESPEFVEAVKTNRMMTRRADYYRAIVQRHQARQKIAE